MLEGGGTVEFANVRDEVGGLAVRGLVPRSDIGVATPVLMVHGGYQGWWAFDRWIRLFASSGWPSYAMSLRGHADSYPVSDDEFAGLSVRSYIDDVVNVCSSLPRPPVLLGHSMGGLVAQCVAQQVCVKALVLVCAAAPRGVGAPTARLHDVAAPVRMDSSAASARWFVGSAEDVIRETVGRLGPESPSALNEIRTRSVEVRPSSVRAPVLALDAEMDMTGVPTARELAKFYHGSALSYANTGHQLMMEPSGEQAVLEISRWLLAALPYEGRAQDLST